MNPAHVITHRRRLLLSAAIVAAAAATATISGCSSLAGRQPANAHPQAPLIPDAPAMGTEPVAKGVYFAIDRSKPLSGEALARALLLPDAALAAIRHRVDSAAAQTQPAPATQSAPSPTAGPTPTQTAATPSSAESPPLAVKYYLRGREHFLDGDNSQAMDALEQALQLDPTAFTVLRLMGRVSFAASQLSRGALYLERAHALRPHDVEVNYLLGRYWLERSDNEHAAYYFDQAGESPEVQITSTETPLSAFYLAIAFQQAGYHLAAAREFQHYLDLIALPVPGYRYDSELSYLISMQWTAQLEAAENFARAGDYRSARPLYQAAAADQPQDAFVVSRLVNALAHLGDKTPARHQALAFLAATRGSQDSTLLLAWAYEATGRGDALIPDLKTFLAHAGNIAIAPEDAALILAATEDDLGRKPDAIAALAAFLAQNPKDLKVLAKELGEATTASEFQTALLATAAAIHADPATTDDVLKLFLPIAKGPAGAAFWKTFILTSRPGPRPTPLPAGAPLPEAEFLAGITGRAQNGDPSSIEGSLRIAVIGEPALFPARAQLVAHLLEQEKFDQVQPLIDQAISQNTHGPEALLLQIKSETAQQRLVHAQELALQARTKFPANLDLHMELASIYRLRGLDPQADAELQSIITGSPAFEPAYLALVNAWFERMHRGEDPGNGLQVISAAVGKLLRENPNSRFGQITLAVLYARDGRLEDAQDVLRTLLSANPDDPDVLIPAADVRQLLGKVQDADTLLESALKRMPQPEVAAALARLYREQDRQPDAAALLKHLAADHPDVPQFAIACERELAEEGKAADSVPVLRDALKHSPADESLAFALSEAQERAGDEPAAVKSLQDFIHANGPTTERLYQLSHYTSAAGMDDASVAALEHVLAIMPDHVGANNDLGFFWADEGIHLDQAEPMIKKALANRPNDAAFLDSLGWVYYKHGKFEQARDTLQKAVDLPDGAQAEVIQHLGDSLYRLGQTPEALERWRQARQTLLGIDNLDPENHKVLDYLTKALDAATAGRQPPLSPLAQPDQPRAAGPTAAPTTAPQ